MKSQMSLYKIKNVKTGRFVTKRPFRPGNPKNLDNILDAVCRANYGTPFILCKRKWVQEKNRFEFIDEVGPPRIRWPEHSVEIFR